MNLIPLVVDLDGTLIFNDILYDSLLVFFRQNPFLFWRLPYLLFRGKAFLKEYLSKYVDLNFECLPYNEELLLWLKEQKNIGRKIVLCTASDRAVAQKVSEHLGIFDEVIASNGTENLSGKAKAKVLVDQFGASGFDYAANAKTDMHVWKQSNKAILVNTSSSVTKIARKIIQIDRVFSLKKFNFAEWFKLFRIHQWIKNILIFMPFLAAHKIGDIGSFVILILAFFAFSFCASSVYVINDMLDLESDRLHPRKKKRPLASGQISLLSGGIAAILLMFSSFLISQKLNTPFKISLLIYFVSTCFYSFKLKQIVLIDCLSLSILYTLRILAGCAAINMGLSFWLLAFSVFLFFSLALVKRFSELKLQTTHSKSKIHGRGYYPFDINLVLVQGISSGFAAVMTFTFYINSLAVKKIYHAPEFLWLDVPILIFWINWIWFQANRDNIQDDPVVFALKDKKSIISGICFICIIMMAALWRV